MAHVLHLLKGADPGPALDVIAQQRAAGDTVTVVLLPGAVLDPPAGVTVRRVPDELAWDGLLDAIFEAEQVIAW